jgi:hypothetical protein
LIALFWEGLGIRLAEKYQNEIDPNNHFDIYGAAKIFISLFALGGI